MNTGARIAKGKILLFLHADTYLPSYAEDLIVTEFSRSDRHWGHFNARLSGHSAWFRIIEWSMNWRSRLTGIVTGDQVLFVQREAFTAAGGFPEIPLMEDITLSRRLKRFGWPLCLNSFAVTSSRYWEERGIVRTILLMWSLRLAYFLGVSPEHLAQIYYDLR
jgi:rSAM/selenodomain-associated transferase 2